MPCGVRKMTHLVVNSMTICHHITSFKREFESHWLMEHNLFVSLDSKLRAKQFDNSVNKANLKEI